MAQGSLGRLLSNSGEDRIQVKIDTRGMGKNGFESYFGRIIERI